MIEEEWQKVKKEFDGRGIDSEMEHYLRAAFYTGVHVGFWKVCSDKLTVPERDANAQALYDDLQREELASAPLTIQQ